MYETERQELVNKISLKGITDTAVLRAIGEVERHKFVPDAMKHHAYNDVALPIGYGQTISQPFTVAYMTQALKLNPGDKVLEIGTGSGYQNKIRHDSVLLHKRGVRLSPRCWPDMLAAYAGRICRTHILKSQVGGADVFVLGQLPAGTFQLDFALGKDVTVIADRQGHLHVLLDQQHGDAQFLELV